MADPARFAAFAFVSLLLSASTAAAESYTFHLEPDDGIVSLDLRQPSFSLRKVYFSLPGQTSDYSVRIETIEPDDEWVYQYLFINSSGMMAVPESVTFDVEVGRSWIESLNVDVDTIAVSRYDEDAGWAPVDFASVSEDTDSLNYRAWPVTLSGLFAVTGEPVLVDIDITSPCNGNDVCEPGRGEDSENCPDCVSLAQAPCFPSERRCIDDSSLLVCDDDGSGYDIEPCAFGCSGGACLSPAGALAGAAVGLNPVLLSVVAALVMVVAYLTLMVHRARLQLSKMEVKKPNHEEVKKLVKS
jgi:hypothetical protein